MFNLFGFCADFQVRNPQSSSLLHAAGTTSQGPKALPAASPSQHNHHHSLDKSMDTPKVSSGTFALDSNPSKGNVDIKQRQHPQSTPHRSHIVHHPSRISPTPELDGSHTAVFSPLSSAVEVSAIICTSPMYLPNPLQLWSVHEVFALVSS